VLDSRAMASVTTWHEVLAGFKALYDLSKSGSDYSTSYLKYRSDPGIDAEARRVSLIFSTSRREIEALIRDIEECRDRIMSQGGGTNRASCLCNIFNQIKAGNDGNVPPIDDWQRMYDELGCSSMR
jgi:hypothetical protein